MNRRELLAALPAAGLLPAAAEPPDDLRLGVCTYSLRNFSRTEAIAMIRRLNVRHVSIKEFHLPYKSTPGERAAGRKEFEAAGLTISSGGVIYIQKDDEADVRFYFEYARDCGMPMIIAGASHATLPRIEKMVKEYGIPVAVHNHGPEDKEFPSPLVALKAIAKMDPRVGVCIDAGHTTRAGADLLESIRLAGARLLDFHVKDLADLKDAKSQCPVGDGAMPVAAVFRELKRMKYRGLVNLEYEIDAADPLPGMQKSFAYMRGVLAGLRG
ncbi:MAG: sugar phosphate isomerase/epimerase family protein [Bryobacteraceae bacterium]